MATQVMMTSSSGMQATSIMSSITARATGCFLNPRTLLRV